MAPAPSLRSRFAASAAVLGLLFATGCSGKKNDTPASSAKLATLQGDITYVRVPLTKDTNGVPTGLETNPANNKVLPARGIYVRAYEYDSTTSQWKFRQVAQTDANGHYAFLVPEGDNYILQVESFTQPYLGSVVSLIADPNGLASTLPQVQRPRYLLRAAPNGTAATPSNPTPSSSVVQGQTYTANFTVDLATSWLTGSIELGAGGVAPGFASAAFEGSPTGSRVLAILDSIYAFSIVAGDPTPGASLDLHYRMGRSESRGTYIEYDPQHWVQPSGVDLAYNPDNGSDDFFGSIQGAASNDDAWDESVLYRLVGRAHVIRQAGGSPYATYPFTLKAVGSPIDGLSSDIAMAEGLPLIIAANLLKSPYLADTDGTSGLVSVTDIRDLSGVAGADIGPYSPRTLAAMLWEVDLKANGITTPGTATAWAALDPKAIARLFTLGQPASGTFVPDHIYLQLAKLKDAKTGAEPVDLAAIFTDTVINTVASPFNLPWPQPSTTAFGQAWTSTTGGTYLYNGTLSMSADHLVNGVYPNESYKELAYLGIAQVNDQTYRLTLQTTPNPLPSGATIQVVVFSGATTQAWTFSGSSASPATFTLAGNGSTASPLQYPVRVRLLSPATLQSDIPFTLQVAPAPPGTLRGPVLGN